MNTTGSFVKIPGAKGLVNATTEHEISIQNDICKRYLSKHTLQEPMPKRYTSHLLKEVTRPQFHKDSTPYITKHRGCIHLEGF
jgi:hypothetical protein